LVTLNDYMQHDQWTRSDNSSFSCANSICLSGLNSRTYVTVMPMIVTLLNS
jgi:hypothetical protein